MDNKEKLEILGSPAVQVHINMLQGVINKMSGNCVSCKQWTVTIVAAMLVLLVDKKMQIPNAWICLIPVVLFYYLDCYYLGLERLCISAQKTFIKNVADNDFVEHLYILEDASGFCVRLCSTIRAINSFSTTPFYLIVAIIVLFFGGII